MNKYTQLSFFSLLIALFALGAAQAQDNAKDPFEIMLNQAREQQRQKIVKSFAESQKQNEAANMQNNSAPNKGANTNRGNSPEQSNMNDANPPSETPSSPPAATGTPGTPPPAPTANIPTPSVNPTNTQQSTAPTNIYAPPPIDNTGAGQLPQQQQNSGQKSANMYG